MTDAEIQGYLEDNGYPPHIVQAGRAGLIKRWQQFVGEVERGYRYTLFDYRNDLDLRGTIETLGIEDPAITDADDRLRALLDHTDVRVWESGPGDCWWDFGYPRNATEDLLEDLAAEGLT